MHSSVPTHFFKEPQVKSHAPDKQVAVPPVGVEQTAQFAPQAATLSGAQAAFPGHR
jgi:hypothetical protein